MRKWLWLSMIVVAGLGGSWYFGGWRQTGTTEPWRSEASEGRVVHQDNDRRTPANDGDAETSDTIEPLVVEGSVPAVAPSASNVTPPERAVLAPGMIQPPRPDAMPRMPYADEDVILIFPLDPLMRILDGTALSGLKIFDGLKRAEPAEESEPKEVAPMPVTDPHHGHCPYLNGGYPYYPRR